MGNVKQAGREKVWFGILPRAFELHTTYADKQAYYQTLKRLHLFLFVLSAALCIVTEAWAWTIFAALFLIPTIVYQIGLMRLKAQADDL